MRGHVIDNNKYGCFLQRAHFILKTDFSELSMCSFEVIFRIYEIKIIFPDSFTGLDKPYWCLLLPTTTNRFYQNKFVIKLLKLNIKGKSHHSEDTMSIA